jgi:hypothetical protein
MRRRRRSEETLTSRIVATHAQLGQEQAQFTVIIN